MKIDMQETKGIKVLAIDGRLDSIGAPQLEEQLNTLIQTGQEKVLIDMTAMDYVSSAGLRVLLSGVKKIKKESGEFALCGLNESAQDVFEVSGFSEIFTIYESNQTALEAM